MVTSKILLYLSSLLTLGWGVAHLIPTRSVVAGFGDITGDNRRILTMEWITEGVMLIFIGVTVATVTFVGSGTAAAIAVSLVASFALVVLALVSLFTGFKVDFLPFKLCPFIFSLSALLIFLALIL